MLVLVAGLVLSLLWVALYLRHPAFVGYVENKTFDIILSGIEAPAPTGVPVVVDLDENSLVQYGQWPWPRYRMAQLLDKLRELGASAIALDIVFAESDRTSLRTVQRDLKRDLDIHLDLAGVPPAMTDNDAILARTLAKGPYVLGYEFLFDQASASSQHVRLHPLTAIFVQAPGAPAVSTAMFQASGVLPNLPEFNRAVGYSGFFNAISDPDGILRRVPMITRFGKKVYPSLALASVLRALGKKQVLIKRRAGGVLSLKVDNAVIPLDETGNFKIRYRGPSRTFDYISAADILGGRVRPDRLKGKIIFVGTSAMGLAELRATPLDPVFPGVEVHATVVDNILRGDFLSPPPFARMLEIALVVVAGVGSALLFAWAGALWSVLALAGVSFGLLQGSVWMVTGYGYLVSPVYPLLAFAGNFSILVLLRFWLEQSKTKRRTAALLRGQDLTLQCLAALAETRDSDTGAHISRTQAYVGVLCRRLAKHDKFKKYLGGHTIEMLEKSAPLHDIGKVGVPDKILLKPGPLNPAEFEEMKKHAEYGHNVIKTAEEHSGDPKGARSFLHHAKDIVYTHHERYNGTGYPQGLAGDDIPIAGRIMALADVYDALTSLRVYRGPISHEDAIKTIIAYSGSQFDPDVVEAFLAVEDEFRTLARELSDK